MCECEICRRQRESTYIRKCECGNFHNWRLIRDIVGSVVEAVCGRCGKSHPVGRYELAK